MRRCLAVALSVCCLAAQADPPRLELSAHVVMRDPPREFGGLSGLIVAEGGGRAAVLTDRGKLFDVGLWRDLDQVLHRVAVLGATYLYIYAPSVVIDTEGLARAPDGGVFVSTEQPTRVLHYAPGSSWPTPTASFPELDIRNDNRSLEALAVDHLGRPVAIPETVPRNETGFPIYRLEGEGWRKVAVLDKRGAFLVVGADHGPDGRLYVLERAASPLGFRSRIRRVDLSDGGAEVETLLETGLGQFDNLEGISLWQDREGRTRITLVSDDNFLALQRTEFVEFLLGE